MLIHHRVSMAMYIKETTWEIIGCYIGLHVICYSISRGYHTTQWSWLVSFLYPSTCCRTHRSACTGDIYRHVPMYNVFLCIMYNVFLFIDTNVFENILVFFLNSFLLRLQIFLKSLHFSHCLILFTVSCFRPFDVYVCLYILFLV